MGKLANINKSVLQIGQLLAQNSKIASLLYYDTPDALEQDIDISLNQLINDKYITVYPPVETAIKDITRNTFLIILLDNINLRYTDNNKSANITIYVSTDADHILLENNKNRLLELNDLIVETLDNKKLSSAGQIMISSISHVMLNEFRAGYRISLSLTDQEIRKAEI